MATDKIQTGLRLEEVVLKKITYIAKQETRSLNAQIEHAVKRAIQEYEAQYGEVPIEA